ncbi:L-alanine-DL-glutamate epimerase [Flavobacteriaceae bacterium MAR_2010_188]|nr:L-alanine-DL-glutamate epimerase [Flavobacteriaceae bacterium MAR_2010_188]
MKIVNVQFERLNLKLSEPYTIAYETIEHTTNFILNLETENSLVGRGCAAPDLEVTGENPDEAELIIKDVVVPFLKGKNSIRYVYIVEELKLLIPKNPSVLAMVDMALLDLCSKKMEVPLFQFLGGYRESIATSITIGILPLQETLLKSKEFVSAGFNIIKLKGGLSYEEDIEKILKIRELYPELTLRFDGNQGYSVEQAVNFVNGTKNAKIEIFEQPSKVNQELQLGEITNAVNLPVMADESIKTLKDAFRLAQNERIDMVNIKIMKVGGILEALHINSVSKSANLEVMVGCIDECGLGISAGLHFALSRPNIQYADLDGHLDILDDPFTNLFQLKNGILYPNKFAGLG